jgi:hypothetical protein
MKLPWRQCVLAAALSFTAAASGLLVAGTAQAQTVTTGSVSFKGDSGDYISQGKSWSYATSNGDALDVTSSNGTSVHIRINAYNGDWWTLDFDAPGTSDRPVPGQSAVLVPGTYASAHRYPFNGTGPGLDLSGEGRGCNELTGSFTVTKAVFVGGYVQAFDATFEQHCEGGTPAARGEVHISNAPPPAGTAATKNAAPTTKPGAAATSRPSAPTASGGPSNDNDARVPPMAAAARQTDQTRLLQIELGLVAWLGLVIAGLLTAGLVFAIRRR